MTIMNAPLPPLRLESLKGQGPREAERAASVSYKGPEGQEVKDWSIDPCCGFWQMCSLPCYCSFCCCSQCVYAATMDSVGIDSTLRNAASYVSGFVENDTVKDVANVVNLVASGRNRQKLMQKLFDRFEGGQFFQVCFFWGTSCQETNEVMNVWRAAGYEVEYDCCSRVALCGCSGFRVRKDGGRWEYPDPRKIADRLYETTDDARGPLNIKASLAPMLALRAGDATWERV